MALRWIAIAVLLALLSMVTAQNKSEDEIDETDTDLEDELRIINGKEDNANLFSFATKINITFREQAPSTSSISRICTGTLISLRHVLTAASCFKEDTAHTLGDIQVTIESRKNNRRNAVTVLAQGVEQTDKEGLAILTLPRQVWPLPHGTRIAALPQNRRRWGDKGDRNNNQANQWRNKVLFASGWGNVAASNDPDGWDLRTTRVTGTDCAATVQEKDSICITETILCAGDTGGPLMESISRPGGWNEGRPTFVIGVAKDLGDTTTTCKGSQYIQVLPHVRWIQTVMRRKVYADNRYN